MNARNSIFLGDIWTNLNGMFCERRYDDDEGVLKRELWLWALIWCSTEVNALLQQVENIFIVFS